MTFTSQFTPSTLGAPLGVVQGFKVGTGVTGDVCEAFAFRE